MTYEQIQELACKLSAEDLKTLISISEDKLIINEFNNTLKAIESEFLKFKNKVQRNKLILCCTLYNKDGYFICETEI